MAGKASAEKGGRNNGIGVAFPGAAVPNLEPLVEAGNKMLESWVQLSNQILEFSKARIDQSLEASRAIAGSSSINEAMDLQAQFTRSMVQEYLTEATKIADMSTRTIIEGFTAMQKTANLEPPHAQAAE